MADLLSLDIYEQKFRNLFNEAPFSAAFLSGSEFVVEMANDASLRLWGKDKSVIGRPLLKAIPEMRDQPVYHALRDVYQTGQIYEGKEGIAYLEINGVLQKVYVNFIYKPVRDDHGHITGVLAVGYDVTDQVVAREKLQQSEERSQLAIELTGLGTFDHDYRTGYTYSSERFAQIFGFDGPVPHEAYISRVHPEDRAIRAEAHRIGLATGKVSYETRLLLPDQSIRWVKVNGRIEFDERRNPTRLIGTALDITQEKLSLMHLQESEERFRTLIVETPQVGVGLYLGAELKIQYVNEVMLKFFGKDSSIIGKPIREALPELEGQPFFDQFERVFKTGEEFIGKEVEALLMVDGQLKPAYYNYSYKALRNSDGDIYAIHHMAIDVTEQVHNKLRLMEREESVRSLFRQTPVGIAIFKGESLIIEMANDAILRYWGRTHEQAINQPVWEVLPEVQAQGLKKIAEEVYRTGIPFSSSETPFSLMRNGVEETIYVHFALQPYRDVDGKTVGLMGIVNEVTELVNARKKAEGNETRLQNLADSMPQVVWVADETGTVTYYNNRVNEFAGATKLDDGTWQWEGILHPGDLAATAIAWDLSSRTGRPYQMEHRVLMRDGTYRWHLSRAYRFVNEQTGVTWYGTATDVHDQKVMEMNLEKKVKERTLELQRSNDDLQQFAHVASHDLKEPVRKIKTFSNKLRDEFSPLLGDRGNHFISKIIHSTDRMYSMIDGVLNYSSLSTMGTTMQTVDINHVIKVIETDLEMPITEKNASITVGPLHRIWGVPDLIYQLFYNLMNNALKFSRQHVPCAIVITSEQITESGDKFIKIRFSDNGIGFDESYAEQIFATFFRLNSKDKYEGTGLGLALCKKIVERHGGTITASGKTGEGATFTFTLPDGDSFQPGTA
jgi:PAS domain S-box-containing protein